MRPGGQQPIEVCSDKRIRRESTALRALVQAASEIGSDQPALTGFVKYECTAPENLFALGKPAEEVGDELLADRQDAAATCVVSGQRESRHASSQRSRQFAERIPQVSVYVEEGGIVTVAAKQLVGPLADLNYLGAGAAGQARDIMKRHAHRVRDGFILVEDQVGKRIEQVLLIYDDFVMISSIFAGDGSGFFQLVKIRTVLEADCECPNRLAHHTG